MDTTTVVEARPRTKAVQRTMIGAYLAVMFALAGAVDAMAATAPPDPATVAGNLVNSAGTSMLDAIVGVLPVVVPFLVALWAIGFVWKKVRPKGGGIG